MQTQLLSFIMFTQQLYICLTIRSIMVGTLVTFTPWPILNFVRPSNSPQCSPAVTHLCPSLLNCSQPGTALDLSALTFYSSLNDYNLFNGRKSVDNKLVRRWMTQSCPNFRRYLPICLKSLRHTTRSQDNQCLGCDLDLRPPDFEKGVLPTQLQSSMNFSAKLSCLVRHVHRILKSDC